MREERGGKKGGETGKGERGRGAILNAAPLTAKEGGGGDRKRGGKRGLLGMIGLNKFCASWV